jgi:predicted O-linked N-acetylglucosamine transferase (SPINDLY family)
LGNLAGARQCLRDAVALQPDFAAAHCNLSGVLQEEGLVDEALSAAHRALELDPDSPIAHSNLFITMHYSGCFNAAAVYEEARKFNARHAKPLTASALQHSNDCLPERRLRIGYVSADFRQHPVGFFSNLSWRATTSSTSKSFAIRV